MKLPVSKIHLIPVIGIILVLGITGCYLAMGIFFPSYNLPQANVTTEGEHLVNNQKVIDTQFAIQEWNLSFARKSTIIRLTDEELKEFPDLEKSLQGVNNNSQGWQNGRRVIAGFDGNMSDYIRFYNMPCKNKTLDVCYPYPTLYEYHGQFFTIFSEMYGSHTLAGCERGNYNCSR